MGVVPLIFIWDVLISQAALGPVSWLFQEDD